MVRQLSHHDCRRFRREIGDCPFNGRLGHEDNEEPEPDASKEGERAIQLPKAMDEGERIEDRDRNADAERLPIPFFIPLPGRKDQGKEKPTRFPQQAPKVDIPRREVETPPIAAMARDLVQNAQRSQNTGGLEWLPVIESVLRERSSQGGIGLVALLTVLEGLRRSGATPSSMSGRQVGRLETQSAGQLRQLGRTTQTPAKGTGPLRGRGGFDMNALEQLNQDLGLKLGGAF